MTSPIEKFNIHVPDDVLDDLKTRLALTRFPNELQLSPGEEWSYGTPEQVTRNLVEYWRTSFDWRHIEDEINAHLPQYTAVVNTGSEEHGSLRLHFVHKRSTRPNAVPLIFSHGWPGSFLEVSKIIEGLTEPTDPKHPAFHVVAPSLPGYCFSEPSRKPGLSLKATAYMFNELMKLLGYTAYMAQGGDWGAMVIRALAIWHPENCKAIHSNMFITTMPTPIRHPFKLVKLIGAVLGSFVGLEIGYSKDELEGLKFSKYFMEEESGYMHVQSTKPQTLAYGLTDSPVGLLTWLHEKLRRWTDDYPWTDDEILTWVMLYWINGPVGSLRYYKEAKTPYLKTDERTYVVSQYTNVPLGVSVFPNEVFRFPHDWGHMVQPLKFWKKHEKGGHFAAWERPKILIDDIRQFTEIVVQDDLSLRSNTIST
ncbi:alpha/beta-hydrolase [Sistotremastrum suecicum HHB10207 ss-3]|uniref:Alpha/beta-hydrolase n=1 Tax=Sistotremastrum suecicum HHB10207 ss-3 TaxID=1314776 RepID=A0A165ZSV3_9AGAM|nr:alpha/beta-hydrolase [Sistotremastrum suecicum HHB10207 ss-3]